MALHPGQYPLGPGNGRVLLRTLRDGLAAQVGHDLTIEVSRWSGELAVGDDERPAGLTVRIDLGSLTVLRGTGGVKPLTDKDRRDIVGNARKTLSVDRHPEATFEAAEFSPDDAGGGVVSGTLTLAGSSQPLRLQIGRTGDGTYRVTATVVQSAHGVKRYTGFFGALKVRDAVEVEIDLDLSGAPG